MCCNFAAGEPRQPSYQHWEKQLPPIRDMGSTLGGHTAHPEVMRTRKGPQLGCPITTMLWDCNSGGAPACTPHGGMPSKRWFPESTVPVGMSTKAVRSGPSPPGAVSSGRGRELSTVSINSPCSKQPCVRRGTTGLGEPKLGASSRGGGDWLPWEASRGSACFSQTGI